METAPDWLLKRALGGRQMVKDPITDLQEMVEVKLKFVRNIVSRIKQSLRQAKRPRIGFMAYRLDQFYMGIERILKRIVQNLDKQVPTSAEWHRELLDMTVKECSNVRPAILDEPLRERLDEFRRFRHIVRNIYEPQLDLERVQDLAKKVSETFTSFELALRSFFVELKRKNEMAKQRLR